MSYVWITSESEDHTSTRMQIEQILKQKIPVYHNEQDAIKTWNGDNDLIIFTTQYLAVEIENAFGKSEGVREIICIDIDESELSCLRKKGVVGNKFKKGFESRD